MISVRKACGLVLVCLLAAARAGAQSDAPSSMPADTQAFKAIAELLPKTRQGGAKPTAADLASRREAGNEIASRARKFLRDYPGSEKAEDARALTGVGLCEAAVAGDADAAKELEEFAATTLQDPKLPEMLKLHAVLVNHVAQWARKNGKTSLPPGSPEFQNAYAEGLFAAADVLPDKDAIFKMLLLQAKSGSELSAAEKQQLAERVLQHGSASEAIKTEARGILSGKRPYAVGQPLEIQFTAVDGRTVDLSRMKGKVVLVDFWATWCGPCVGEVPSLKQTYNTYHANGFEIVGISLDDNRKTLLDFVKKHEMAWPQYFDGKHWNNEISFRFGINSVPTQWLVDKQGILRELNARSNLEESVKRLLQE